MNFRNFVRALICDHVYTRWEREARELKGPFGITGPHYYQTRRCEQCGWHQEAEVEVVKKTAA